ncbi:MAG: group 1 truncated hemoglobin [Planctomycetes bacterium]|nr:group 1 truncated hemoglobin [Planctomycetota bacterium]
MRRMFVVSALAVAAGMFASLAGCQSGGKTECGGACSTGGPCCQDAKGKSLYERLGGEPAITAVTDDFVDRLAKNPKVNVTRKGAGKEWNASPENVAALKKSLTAFVCQAAGGPQKYAGKDMKTVHAGMNISAAEFAASGDDLVATLKKFGVGQKEQDELLALVGTTKKDVVTK